MTDSSHARSRPASRSRNRGPVPPVWRRAPFLLLILSLALAVVGAWQAHQAIVGHRAAVEGVLHDYAAFAAWTFSRHAEDRWVPLAQATFRPVLRAQAAGGDFPPARELLPVEESLDECGCARTLAGDFAFRIPLAEEGEIEVAGAGLDPHRDREAIREFQDYALAQAHEDRVAGIASMKVEGERRWVAFLTLGCLDLEGFHTIYGVDVAPLRLTELFQEIHGEGDLLPPTLTGELDNAALLRVAVRDPDGDNLFGAPVDESAGLSWASLGPSYGDLEVAAAVVPDAAGRLVIGGLPHSRAGFMLGIFGLAILLGVVAVTQLRRENELALLRSDFVAGVSHELRTPLAQIRLFLETLRMGRFQTEGEREWSLATIDRETRRLSHLVENVLHFSRAEKGVAPSDTGRLALDAELRDIEESFRPLARARRARIRVEVEGDLWAEVNRESFRQVVLNLLDNAVKYGPRGQLIRLRAQGRDGGVEVVVEDQGPGVPLEERDRIWEPFQRGSHAGSGEAGSGIGLSVVREIAVRSGGGVRVGDGPDGGARFIVELPGGRRPVTHGAAAGSGNWRPTPGRVVGAGATSADGAA